ncbi:MAG: DsbA family protein [Pseudomonadota bacterium]
MTARRVFLLAGAGMVAAALWRGRGVSTNALRFAPVGSLPGYRKLTGIGATSGNGRGSFDPLTIGLGATAGVDPAQRAHVQENADRVLFGETAAPAMAYFTDIRCPICRPFERDLDVLQEEIPGLSRVVHEFPIFGQDSVRAAQALIAAGPELRPVLRNRLQRAPVVINDAYLTTVIASLDADPEPILAAMEGAAVQDTLSTSRALAELFGFVGTPALVMGHTAILGAQPLRVLRAVAEAEFT